MTRVFFPLALIFLVFLLVSWFIRGHVVTEIMFRCLLLDRQKLKIKVFLRTTRPGSSKDAEGSPKMNELKMTYTSFGLIRWKWPGAELAKKDCFFKVYAILQTEDNKFQKQLCVNT